MTLSPGLHTSLTLRGKRIQLICLPPSSEFFKFPPPPLTSAEAINSEAFPDTVLAQTDVGEPHPREGVDLGQLPQEDDAEGAGEDVKVRGGQDQGPVSLPLHWQAYLGLAKVRVRTHRVQQGDLRTSEQSLR